MKMTIEEILDLRRSLTGGPWQVLKKNSVASPGVEGHPRYDILRATKRGRYQICHFHTANTRNPDLADYETPIETDANMYAIANLHSIIDSLLSALGHEVEALPSPEPLGPSEVRPKGPRRDGREITPGELEEKYKV